MSGELKPVRAIVIVGGGSSGWMTAAYLSKVLFDVDITLIESASTPTIGVGEATLPFIRNFFRRIGLTDDRQWMSTCDATFKTGIFYQNWYERHDEYWHPLLENLDYIDDDIHTGHCWLYLHKQKHPAYLTKRSFYESCFMTSTLNLQQHRIPAARDYAYHIDAGLFVKLLQSVAPTVKHIIDDVGAVRLNEMGEIEGVSTKHSGEIRADLYIDCTGFKRHLIGQVAPDLKFIPYSSSLFCDSAVVLRFPYDNEEHKITQMHPFVKASAQSAGWLWTIPLYSRVSSGYVYSSSFISADEAELELRRYWGEHRTTNSTALKLKFATGKLQRLWAKNCVAMGLSGGFIEPLESTGLAIAQLGIEMLASMLDARYYDHQMIDRYNGYLDKFYTDIMQFLVAHYKFTKREDTTFWRAAKYETVIPAALQARLDIFHKHLPTSSTKGTSEVWMFGDVSWFSVLLGMGFEFEVPKVNRAALIAFHLLLEDKRQVIKDMTATLPDHAAYLKERVYNGTSGRT